MFSTNEEVKKYLKDEGVEFVDVRFIDLPGVMQHFNMPTSAFDDAAFEDGLMFDGSSIRGFQAINESDMKLLPDPATAYLDPFRKAKTLVMLVPDGARDQRAGWGTELADLDNDGLLDVIAVYGPTEGVMLGVEPGPLLQPDAVWMQGPDGSFVDRARALGLDGTTNGRGLIVADLDDDGWLDILKVDYRGGPAQLWRQRCGEAAWLTLRLEGPPGNPRGLGARVELEAGGRRFTRWQLQGNSGLASQGPGALHFGLGDVDEIDALRVIWPDGRVDELGPVGARRAVVVRRGG